MDPKQIEQRLRELLAEKTGLDPSNIRRDIPLLRGGLELDSLTVASFVVAVQDTFEVDLLEEDLTLSSLESLDALVQFVAERWRNP